MARLWLAAAMVDPRVWYMADLTFPQSVKGLEVFSLMPSVYLLGSALSPGDQSLWSNLPVL